jgi:hypothetical protein
MLRSRAMPHPRRLTGLETARARFGDQADRIAEFFSESDRLADAAVLALRDLPQGRSLLARALERGIDAALDEGGMSLDERHPLMQLFRQLEHVPFWVDRERCARGGEVFLRCGIFGGIALGFGSLARAYCSSGGNKPLALTGALIDTAPARIANTGRFLHAVSQRDGLRVGATGYVQTVHVRLMHARIRLDLLSRGPWQAEDWGVPINQADMALTALLFSHGFAGFVRKLGVRVTDEEEADLVHLWRYAGYLMGVREELLCATVAEAEKLATLVDVMDSGPDADSRRLLEPLLRREPTEVALRSPRLHQAARRVFEAACRDMIGESFADHVGLPWGPSDLAFRYLLRPTVSVLNRVHRRVPGAATRARRFGERYWSAVSNDPKTKPSAQQVATARTTETLA